jgi:hypothetical protein
MYDLISWTLAATTHLQTLFFIVLALLILPLFLALDFMDVMGALSIIGLVLYVYM